MQISEGLSSRGSYGDGCCLSDHRARFANAATDVRVTFYAPERHADSDPRHLVHDRRVLLDRHGRDRGQIKRRVRLRMRRSEPSAFRTEALLTPLASIAIPLQRRYRNA